MGIIFGWLILSIVVGFLADQRGRSGIGYFFLSLLLSPILGLIFVLVLPNKIEVAAEEKRRANDHEKQLEAIRALQKGAPAPPPASIADEITKLAGLREKGVLTDEEFQAHKAALLSR